MKTITVFCSANDVAEKYKKDARKFAQLMVKHGYDLVWGGSNRGVMKLVASTVQNLGGKIIGISVEMLKQQRRKNADEMIVTPTLDKRKSLLLERGSAVIMMPGGWGSLDELTEILELKKHRVHDKPVVVLNTDGFWNGLKQQVARFGKEGFSPRPVDEMIYFAPDPQKAIEYIDSVLK